jgi:hypothetical protein
MGKGATMSAYSRFDLLAGSFIIGVLMVVMAIVAITPNPFEPLYAALDARELNEFSACVLFMLGSMVMYGSVKPKRNCRHLGLALGSVMMFLLFGVMLVAGWLTLSSLILLVLAFMSLGLYAFDAHIHVRGVRDAQVT